jgi:hypothetical protein
MNLFDGKPTRNAKKIDETTTIPTIYIGNV